MKKNERTRGFSIIELSMVAAILGISVIAFFNFSKSIQTAKGSQTDLETRVDLFQTLNFFQRVTDCQSTLSDLPTGTAISADGTPIALKGASGGTDLISEFGTKRGKFSYIADAYPDSTIKIRAAAFKSAGELPRNRLSASDDEFLSKKATPGIWSWAYTTDLISQDFSTVATLCGQAGSGTAAAAGAGGKVTINCTMGEFCLVSNSETGAVCHTSPYPGSTVIMHDYNIQAWRRLAYETPAGEVVKPPSIPAQQYIQECIDFVSGKKTGLRGTIP